MAVFFGSGIYECVKRHQQGKTVPSKFCIVASNDGKYFGVVPSYGGYASWSDIFDHNKPLTTIEQARRFAWHWDEVMKRPSSASADGPKVTNWHEVECAQ